MSFELALKSGYVSVARGAGRLGRELGLLGRLERMSHRSRMAHWMRSLPEIHNLEGMVALDVPWWTYTAIARVEQHLAETPGARIFEYGSGASTIWLARRARAVTSVEHHKGWYDKMADVLAHQKGLAPIDLRLVAPDAPAHPDPLYRSAKAGTDMASFAGYAQSIEHTPECGYDLIVIDGRARAACLAHAAARLAPSGMIVFDNSGRARYRAAIRESGLAATPYRGLTPSLPYPDETTLLTRHPE
ncbi:MAG: class I SAM-dependent methyltransferase [Pseudomonadota bacterium]